MWSEARLTFRRGDSIRSESFMAKSKDTYSEKEAERRFEQALKGTAKARPAKKKKPQAAKKKK